MLLVCLNTRGSTQEAIHASRVFGVNILDEDQGIVAERFASTRGPKFDGLTVDRGAGGVPLLADSLAYCECRVAEDVVAGTHRVFLANVTRAVAREGSPLDLFPRQVRSVRGRAGSGHLRRATNPHSQSNVHVARLPGHRNLGQGVRDPAGHDLPRSHQTRRRRSAGSRPGTRLRGQTGHRGDLRPSVQCPVRDRTRGRGQHGGPGE